MYSASWVLCTGKQKIINRLPPILTGHWLGFLKLQDDFRYISTGISLSILYRNLQLPDSSLYILEQCKAVDSRLPATWVCNDTGAPGKELLSEETVQQALDIF